MAARPRSGSGPAPAPAPLPLPLRPRFPSRSGPAPAALQRAGEPRCAPGGPPLGGRAGQVPGQYQSTGPGSFAEPDRCSAAGRLAVQRQLPMRERPWHQVQKCPVGQKSPGVTNAGHVPTYPLWGPVCFTGSICPPCWDLAGEAGGCVTLSCFWLPSSAAGSAGSCALLKDNSWGSCRHGPHPAQSSPLLSSSVHKNTVCGCERGPVGTILSENTGEQLYWLQKTHARWLC